MSLKKYNLLYLILYIVVFIVLAIIFHLLDTRTTLVPTIIVAFLPATIVLKAFITDHKRAPTRSEQLRLTWWSIASVWGVSTSAVILVFIYLLWTKTLSTEELRLGLLYLFHTTERFVYLVVLIFIMIITAIFYGGFMHLYGKVAQREVSKQQAKDQS